MDERLKLYKVRFDNPYGNNYELNGDAIEEMLFARNIDEAWTKFYSHSKKKGYNPFNVRVNELSTEEMKHIEVLVPFYKEYER